MHFSELDKRPRVESILNNSPPDRVCENLRELLGHPKRITATEMVFDNGMRIVWKDGKRILE
jgi:hypothetical protein